MRIILRSVESSDLERIRRHRNEPVTQRWLEAQIFIDLKSQQVWFKSGGACSFRIIQEGDRDIGLGRLLVSKDAQWCTVGLDIFSEYRGQRLATPAFQAVIEDGLKLASHLDLWVFIANTFAIRTYIQCGFIHDHSTPVKFFTREIDGQIGVHSYVRMIYKQNA